MAVSLLRTRVSNPGDLRMLDILEKSADRGAGLVRQILGFVHGMGGEPRVLQVKHLLHDISEIITGTFPKSIVLEEQVPNDLWPILANPTQIHQVLLNLCVNARDAMPQGGTLTLGAANCVLDVADAQAIEGAAPGAWLVLHVEDTGTGIAPELLERIWEPFFTTKAAGEGTGLGLSTVRGIIGAFHGFMTLKTEAGRGTTIRAYLPVAPVNAVGETSFSPFEIEQGRGELILFVDDEQPICDMLAATLAHGGYRTVVASNGEEALAVLGDKLKDISLVITDLDMPRMGGETLARAIRIISPSMKILVMSGLANRYSREKPCDFASAFLQKPFTVDSLLNQVQRLLPGALSRPPMPSMRPAQSGSTPAAGALS
jgi:CheY-like chemotaxis protein